MFHDVLKAYHILWTIINNNNLILSF